MSCRGRSATRLGCRNFYRRRQRINIADNPPETRVEKLQEFWDLVTSRHAPWQTSADGQSAAKIWPWVLADDFARLFKGDLARAVLNQWNANLALVSGAAGFFSPRALTPWLWPDGSLGATNYYDTSFLASTLERLVDFDRVNSGVVRLSIGAVNVRSGNLAYFDTTKRRIEAKHVMVSGALLPGFPAVEIDGEHYWDGGLVSNTPLHWIVEARPQRDTLAFQVDLWSAQGQFPRNMANVARRQKEIQYSSRTRAASNRFTEMQCSRNSISVLLPT